jgi:hypothetical protein
MEAKKMIQQTHQEQVHSNEMVHEAGFGIGRLLITVLKGCFGILRKIVSSVAYGFAIFVNSAEQHGLPRK